MNSGYLFNPVLFWAVLLGAGMLAAYILWCYVTSAHKLRWILLSLGIGLVVAISTYGMLRAKFGVNVPVVASCLLSPVVMVAVLGAIGMRRSLAYIAAYIGSIVLGLSAVGLAANNYYGYFPTFASMFQSIETQNLPDVPTYHPPKGAFVPLDQQRLNPPTTTKGTVFNVSIPGTVSGYKARKAIVYLPPAYDANPLTFFPVLVLLNGFPGAPSDWLACGQAPQSLDAFAAKHNGLAPIVIIPDHNGPNQGPSGCVNSTKIGNVETYLTTDVPRYAEQKLRVLPEAQHWSIGGLSEGGMCGQLLVLRNPSTFKTFLNLSGMPYPTTEESTPPLDLFFDGDVQAQREHNSDYLLQTRTYHGIGGRYVVGTADPSPGLVADTLQTYQLAKQKGLDVELQLIPGEGHSFTVWSQGLRDSLPFISERIQLTSP